jgi:hypothetical protein
MTRTGALIVTAVIIAAFFVGSMASSQQPAARGATGTFQIDAYGNNLGGGAYIVNTETGDVFIVQHGAAPQFVGTANR